MIRRASEEDARQLLSVMEDAESSGFMLYAPGERHMTEPALQKFIALLNGAAKSGIFVAVEDEQIVGYMMVKAENLSRTSHRAAIAIGVHSNSRGKGVGTKLFEHVTQWGLQQHIRRLELTVIEHNEQAVHLYKKMGFDVEGIKRDSLQMDGQYVNELYMSKLLG